MPLCGTSRRTYSNAATAGGDIEPPAGASLAAPKLSTVAAITKGSAGGAVVLRLDAEGLLTFHTTVDILLVMKGDAATLAHKVAMARAGTPSLLHFEVPIGLQSVYPDRYSSNVRRGDVVHHPTAAARTDDEFLGHAARRRAACLLPVDRVFKKHFRFHRFPMSRAVPNNLTQARTYITTIKAQPQPEGIRQADLFFKVRARINGP